MVIALMQLLKASDDWETNEPQVMTFMIATATWISLVNITKTITSDQLAYSWLFNNVSVRGFYSTVFESWGGTGKEPIYSFITWILYYICGGSLRLFFFTLSMMIYMFHYMATYKLFRTIDATKGTVICGVIILTFFTQYFVMTLHIIRQMLAAAIAIYAIVYRATERKNNWWMLIAAPFIHTSAFFLVGLSLIPWIYSWMNLKKITIVLACFLPIIVFSGTVGSWLGGASGIEALSYAGQRLGDEGASDGGSISLSILLTVFIPLGICALSVINHSSVEKNIDDEESRHYLPLLPIAYLAILVIIFVLSFSKTPIIQYRFFYYSYSFVPLLLPILFLKSNISGLYQFGLSFFFFMRFFIGHNASGFYYAPTINLVIQPIIYYFTGNFSSLYIN